jgi:hypothetical protein
MDLRQAGPFEVAIRVCAILHTVKIDGTPRTDAVLPASQRPTPNLCTFKDLPRGNQKSLSTVMPLIAIAVQQSCSWQILMLCFLCLSFPKSQTPQKKPVEKPQSET